MIHRKLFLPALLLASLTASSWAQESPASGGRPALPEIKGKHAGEIKDLLADVVEKAMNPSGPRGLHKLITREDRQRIGNEGISREKEVDARVLRVRDAWKEKYGKAFNTAKEEDLFPRARVYSDGRIARVTLPGTKNQVTLYLNLVKERGLGGGWRIDVPDNLNQLTYQATPGLAAGRVEMKRGAWPQDVRDAHRFAAHDILMPFAQSTDRSQ